MAVHAYFTAAAILLGASVGGTMDVSPPSDETLLIAGHEALAGAEKIAVALTAPESPHVEKLADAGKLRAQIVTKLKEAGIQYADGESESCPRLVVQIEGVAVPDCDQWVYRVQTSMSRIVTFAAHREMQVEAEVWRLSPVMKAAAATQADKMVTNTVLTQVEAFIDAYASARKLQTRLTEAEPNSPGSAGPSRATSGTQAVQAASSFPFVASRNASVFHRSDCRWAQNISEDNRVGYKTREEAVQAGKRPCKSCKP